MEQSFTSVSQIGRNALLHKLKQYKGYQHASLINEIGDDAAVLSLDNDKVSLLTSDTFVEGADFDPTYTPFMHFGYKMISASISDILAMNGSPSAVLINLAIPNRVSVEMIEDLYKGIDQACKDYGIAIAGGDITGNHQNAVFTVSVAGEVDKSDVVSRNGAKQGDAICVTGDLGAAIAGLRILMREKTFWEKHGDQGAQPDLGDYKFVVERQLMPKARLDVIKTLKVHGIVPSSMIDLTKGVIEEVTQITEQSNLGAHLYQAALPIAVETRQVADEMEKDVDKYALYGGEDLELIFTLPEKEVDELIKHFNDFSVIGRMTPKEDGLIIQTAEGDLIGFDEMS
jgi:thiamine-monophosphate kinase